MPTRPSEGRDEMGWDEMIRRGAVDASDYKRSIRLQEKLQIEEKLQMTRQATEDKIVDLLID